LCCDTAPQPQVIKLKIYDASFEKRDRAGIYFYFPFLTPRAACEYSKTNNRAAVFSAAAFAWHAGRGFP